MKIVAIKEMSAGNDSVGDQWLETKIFEPHDLLHTVLAWGGEKKGRGKLIITVANEDIRV